MRERPRPTDSNNRCAQCGNEHRIPDNMRCDCGACLYKHGTQKDISQEELEMYPSLKCELCGKVSFCD